MRDDTDDEREFSKIIENGNRKDVRFGRIGEYQLYCQIICSGKNTNKNQKKKNHEKIRNILSEKTI